MSSRGRERTSNSRRDRTNSTRGPAPASVNRTSSAREATRERDRVNNVDTYSDLETAADITGLGPVVRTDVATEEPAEDEPAPQERAPEPETLPDMSGPAVTIEVPAEEPAITAKEAPQERAVQGLEAQAALLLRATARLTQEVQRKDAEIERLRLRLELSSARRSQSLKLKDAEIERLSTELSGARGSPPLKV